MRSLAAALFRLALAPTALVLLWLGPFSVGAPAFGHALVDVQSDLTQREKAVAFEPGEGTPFPAFHLQDADGKTVDLAHWRGKVVVLDFASTSCAGDCAAQNDVLATIQNDVAAGKMTDQVELLSISLDPARDTAAARQAFGAAHGLKPVNWTFLAGDDGPRMAKSLGLAVDKGTLGKQAGGPFKTAAVTYVVDSAGMLRARFFGVTYNPINLLVYVNALTNDHHEGDHHERDETPAASGSSLSGGSFWQKLKRWL